MFADVIMRRNSERIPGIVRDWEGISEELHASAKPRRSISSILELKCPQAQEEVGRARALDPAWEVGTRSLPRPFLSRLTGLSPSTLLPSCSSPHLRVSLNTTRSALDAVCHILSRIYRRRTIRREAWRSEPATTYMYTPLATGLPRSSSPSHRTVFAPAEARPRHRVRTCSPDVP